MENDNYALILNLTNEVSYLLQLMISKELTLENANTTHIHDQQMKGVNITALDRQLKLIQSPNKDHKFLTEVDNISSNIKEYPSDGYFRIFTASSDENTHSLTFDYVLILVRKYPIFDKCSYAFDYYMAHHVFETRSNLKTLVGVTIAGTFLIGLAVGSLPLIVGGIIGSSALGFMGVGSVGIIINHLPLFNNKGTIGLIAAISGLVLTTHEMDIHVNSNDLLTAHLLYHLHRLGCTLFNGNRLFIKL